MKTRATWCMATRPYTCTSCFEASLYQGVMSVYGVCAACGSLTVEDKAHVATYAPDAVSTLVEMGFGGRC